jgi:hypothetical protein
MTFDARLGEAVKDLPGYGWGYGFGACDRWQADTVYGFQLQYGKIVNADGTISPLPSWQPLPSKNETRVTRLHAESVKVDDQWHTWEVNVRDGKLIASQDAQKSMPFPLSNVGARAGSPQDQLPADCSEHDIFMRVYNGTAQFQNIKVQPVKV